MTTPLVSSRLWHWMFRGLLFFRAPDFETVVYFRRSQRHLPFELSVGDEGHNPIIVFNYYQNHKETLFYYYPNFVFVKSVFFLIASFFADIFVSCVTSDPFELRLLRVHPFSFDETFVLLCLWPLEPHDVRRHEIVVKGLQSIDKIRETHRSFWTHLLNRDIVTNNVQMNKMSMSIQSFAVKKLYRVCEIWRTSTRQTFHTFSVRQILCISRVFGPYQKELSWGHFSWCNYFTGWISVVILYVPKFTRII